MDQTRTGWLSPDGKFYPCLSYDHGEEAVDLVKKYGYPGIDENERVDDILISNGWVRISIASYMEHNFVINILRPYSQDQLIFLKPYAYGEYGLPLRESCRQEILYQLGELV